MSAYRAALLALCVVGAGLVAAVPAGATTDATAEATEAGVAVTVPNLVVAANNSTNNSSLGADISSFMQSSAAEVGGTVETGMWAAEFNATENRSVQTRLVERRTSELRDRLADLQQRKAELTAEREAGNVSETAYKARVSSLLGQIESLREAINATEPRAEQVGADTTELRTLRTETENLTGPEIAAVARNVSGVSVGNGSGGPPDNVGNGDTNVGNGNGKAGNGNANVGNGNANVGNENASVGNGNNGTGPADGAAGQNGVGPANDTANESRAGGPPGNAGDSPMAGDGNATGNQSNGVPNASTPGDSPGAVDNSSNPGADGQSALSTAVTDLSTVTTDFVAPISDGYDVRSYSIASAFGAR